MESLPSCGTRIYSKTPLADVSAGVLGEPVVLVQISGVETALMPVDTVGPQKGMRAWNAEREAIGNAAATLVNLGAGHQSQPLTDGGCDLRVAATFSVAQSRSRVR